MNKKIYKNRNKFCDIEDKEKIKKASRNHKSSCIKSNDCHNKLKPFINKVC